MANHTPEPLAAELKAKIDELVDAFVAAASDDADATPDPPTRGRTH